ncbi:cytochrome P450 2C4-like [Dendropsophus ebraccatus]|uniref:cytochrome P450 2C4-like n=1 Tax=Dendropsophus ebraccatus TaxID=150705 RepID=UPI0038320838
MTDQDNAIVILVGVVTFLLTLFYWKHVWERRKMPPGPFPLPILGNFLQIHSKGSLQCLTKLAEKFGPIYTIYIGARPTVVLSGYQTIKEALVELGDVFMNRGNIPVFEHLYKHGGLALINDEMWTQLRQFSLMTLKELGMGKKSLEEPLLEEARHLVNHFKNLNGEPFDPSTTLMCATSNITSNLLLGTRYNYDDKKWMKILQNSRDAFLIVSSSWGQLYDAFPGIMRYLPGPHRKIFTLLKPLEDVVKESVESHQKTLDPACPRDYTDYFLLRVKQEEKNSKTVFNVPCLIATVFDMFLGGSESSSVTVNFGFLILVKYPEIQDKVHKEIDQVIGREREPRADDRSLMPYTNALLHEIQRYSDVFPLGFTRSTTRNVTFHGYHLPKGMNIITLLTTVMRDPSHFEKPEEFNINHFLDENNKFKKNDGFMPFAAESCLHRCEAAPGNERDMTELNSITAGLVGFATLIIVFSYAKLIWKRKTLPPGPFPMPVLGNAPHLMSNGLLPSLKKLAEKYGPVYTIHFGSRPTVIVVGYQAAKEVLVDLGDIFLGRGSIPVFERFYNNCGLTLLNGDNWRQMRQFSLLTLKDFGMGKKSLEEPIQVEAQHLVDYFRRSDQQPINPTTTLSCASSNIIASILVGLRYEYTDEKWMKILQDMRESFEIISSPWGQMYDMFPKFMQYVPGPHRKMFDLLKELKELVKENVKIHEGTLDPSCPRDYIDCFLIRMKQENLDSKTCFDKTNLVATVFDMFLGGAETTSVTLNFGILYFIKYPEIQDKLHEEIDQVIGKTREPKLEDRNQMPYMNAMIHEVQRISDTLPLGCIRSATQDVTLRGYKIPKGMDVLPVLTTVLRDPTQFETPNEFNIKHFLDDSGKFKKNNGFMPFAAGKRACVGEGLVRMELFIFFATILQKFKLKSVVDPKDLNISPTECGIESIPPSHQVIFIPRE